MTVFWVQRTGGTSISWAAPAAPDSFGGYINPMPDCLVERLDAATDPELQAFLTAATTAPPADLTAGLLAQALVKKGTLTQGDLATATAISAQAEGKL